MMDRGTSSVAGHRTDNGSMSVAAIAISVRDGFPTFTVEEIERRHAALRDVMETFGVTVAVAFGAGRFNPEMQYLSNWPGGREGYLLLPLEGNPTLFVQFFNHLPLARRLSCVPDTVWAGPVSVETVADRLKAYGESTRIGLIGPWRASDRDLLASRLPDCELIDLHGAYRAMRAIRSEEELHFFRVAARLSDLSMERLEQEIRPGLREFELAGIVERTYLEHGGYAGIHFMSSTSMRRPETCVPHQYQSDRILEVGDVVITEISGSFWGYASQIHRTYTVGEPPTDEYIRLHETAVDAFNAVVARLRDGATSEDVLSAAEVIHDRGYTILDDLLHGADQYPPILRTRATTHGAPHLFTFKKDMIVTIQPHVITPDRRIGVQFGETVRITHDGTEPLHHYRPEIIVVPA